MADIWPCSGVSSVCTVSVCACACAWEMRVVVCTFRRGLPVCKAVSEERFLHSLCYILINLLKPARPVFSSLTHQKSQAAQEFNQDFLHGCQWKITTAPHLTAFWQNMQKCIQSKDKHTRTHTHAVSSPMMAMQWGGHYLGGPSAHETIRSTAYWITFP